MPAHNFQPLYDRYADIIARMPSPFTSHEFILRLAQQHQADYIEALHHYRSSDPFRTVHAHLAKHLHEHSALVVKIDDAPDDPDIFRVQQVCSRWRRLA